MTSSSLTVVRLTTLLALVALILATLARFNPSTEVTVVAEDIVVANQPASQGRPIRPVGELITDSATRRPAVGALPIDFVRSPDRTGPDGKGRYLIAVNSGFGIQFSAATNRAQQSLAVIDLDAKPAPAVVQNVYFPTPQSVSVGLVFAPQPEPDGSYTLYASGGFENKIWILRFQPGASSPITPASPGPNTTVEATSIDVSGFAAKASSPRYNSNRAPVYPLGLAISPDGNTLFVANNLGDSLGIISDLRETRTLTRVDLRPTNNSNTQTESGNGNTQTNRETFVYPYAVVALAARDSAATDKVYVSCWNNESIAVINPRQPARPASFIPVARHPTQMILNTQRTRLYVVNSNGDSVSVIDTRSDREVERINVRLAENAPLGSSPESLALSDEGNTLYVANAHSNSVAVVALKAEVRGQRSEVGRKKLLTSDIRAGSPAEQLRRGARHLTSASKVRGFIPTGQYPSAVAVARGAVFIGNGKGTGFENSSVVVNNSGRVPNKANDRFPVGKGRGSGAGGQYSVALVAGNISRVAEPDERTLARYTQTVMRNNNLLGQQARRLFPGASPIKHIIYIIKENRTYDQVFGDLERAGNGQAADGDPNLAIFGAGDAAQRPNSSTATKQNLSPNHRALALRFGLLDRFFVNSEASPDGHNWSTAAFSTDYTDKAYRWNYSGRGRTYDFEGFNRLPSISPTGEVPPFFPAPVGPDEVSNHMRRFIPYLNGARDVAEPDSLYLWDAVARAGLTYRNYGEFVGTFSEADVQAVNANKAKRYPDVSPTLRAVPTKRTLEGHHSETFRNYDILTPDAMTTDSYRAAKDAVGSVDAMISRTNTEERFRGNSRLGEWLAEFREYVADREAGRPDRLPNFSMLRFPNDHTAGLRADVPTPQFFMADNDYAVGRLVEAVSNSPYWKDTAIFIVEDDAQDGPDHVDAHRSPALVISAYNRPGALVHEFHNTVSLIRTMELLLGLPPMNALDASATPIDIFQTQADLSPYRAVLPEVALDNLITPPTSATSDEATARWMRRTAEQNMTHADMADPRTLNEIIWFSVRGSRSPMPTIARLPVYDAMREGLIEEGEDKEGEEDE
ncbi:MAG: beta-propeller fold lactonase family protein [Pyrinomonadaceae bacterium]|nr:beta-propeller fold lactonase family protein [Pyrinomonadaceae bacterium]